MIKNADDYNQLFYGGEEQDKTILLENEFVINYYKQLNVAKKLCCDFGCGTGYWTKILSNMNANVIGTDISNELINYCRHLYPSIKFVQLKEAQKLKFDFIFVNWVLQEMVNITVLRNALSQLSDMSKLGTQILVVDNIYPDLSKATKINSDRYGEVFRYGDGSEMRFFPLQYIHNLFSDFGYSCSSSIYFGDSFLFTFECQRVNI